MKLKSNYPNTLSYVRQNKRGLTYDIGYRLYQSDDSSFTYGFEIVQELYDGRVSSGATALDFFGSHEEAEHYLVEKLKQMVERLPEGWETDRFRNRKDTDESAVKNAWIVRRLYGYWPEYHDAELIGVALRRRRLDKAWHTDIELTIRHSGQDNPEWKTKEEPCLITILLEDSTGDEFVTDDVASPSWINELLFSHCEDGRIQVDLDPSSGFSMLLYCSAAVVTRIEPCPSELE
jgi:hypothetical protein